MLTDHINLLLTYCCVGQDPTLCDPSPVWQDYQRPYSKAPYGRVAYKKGMY